MLEQLLYDFGYFALFLGTFLEGETILVLAGFAAAHHYLNITTVILIAFAGSYTGDQLWFFLGRHYGLSILERKPHWKKSADKALIYLRKHPDLWVLSFRFIYGLRTIMPVAIGLSGYPPKRYMLLNAIGAIIWSVALGLAAFWFGEAVKVVLHHIKDYELYVLSFFIALALLIWLVRRRKKTNH